MGRRSHRAAVAVERCLRKRRYESWDDARRAGMKVWRENRRPTDANPAGPYPCDTIGPLHYHAGHLIGHLRVLHPPRR